MNCVHTHMCMHVEGKGGCWVCIFTCARIFTRARIFREKEDVGYAYTHVHACSGKRRVLGMHKHMFRGKEDVGRLLLLSALFLSIRFSLSLKLAVSARLAVQ